MNQNQIIINTVNNMNIADRDYGVIDRIEASGLLHHFGGKTPGQTITAKLGTLAKAGAIARSKTNQPSKFWHYASINKQYLLYPTPKTLPPKKAKVKKVKKIMKIDLPMVIDDIVIINGEEFTRTKNHAILF